MTIAVIDSGLDQGNGFFKKSDIGGCSIHFDENLENLIYGDDYGDLNGHGTACSFVISSFCPEASIYSVRVLDKMKISHSLLILEALNHLLEVDCNIISLSLSTENDIYSSQFEAVCTLLQQQGKLIIASSLCSNVTCYPAFSKGVIGVHGTEMKITHSFWYNELKNPQCVADMTPILAPGLKSSLFLFGSTSKAAAMMTGLIASMLIGNIEGFNLSAQLSSKSINSVWSVESLYKEYLGYSELVVDRRDQYDSHLLSDLVDLITKEFEYPDIYVTNLLKINRGVFKDLAGSVIKKLEKQFSFKIEYINITYRDFISIYSIADLVERGMKCNQI